MRAFVAVELPPLEGPLPAGLRPEDHLTLHFFEDLSIDQVPTVVDALNEAAASTNPFVLEIRGVGAFPSPQRPRVVWAGVGEGSETLQRVATRLRQGLTVRGFPPELRPFVPHLTLTRIRTPREAGWAHRFLADPENTSRVWTRGTVSELLLKESELRPTGARHTVRERVGLGARSKSGDGS